MAFDRGRHHPKVAVIGAGIVGAAIAYTLARRGVAVTVVDKGTPGSGATSHSFAWINATAKTPQSYHDFNRRSMGLWDRLTRDLTEDVGLRWGGQLEWASDDAAGAQMKGRAAQLLEWGYPCRLIEKDEILQLEPGLRVGEVAAAVYSDLDGQVEPVAAAQACVSAAVALGAEAALGTTVTGVKRASGGAVEGLETSSRDITADVVVLAAGADTTELAAMAGVNIPQQDSPGVVVRTSVVPKLLNAVSVIYAPPLEPGRPEVHVRQCLDGTAMIGEGSQESLARDDTQAHADELLSRAALYLPGLAAAAAVPVPVGYRPMPLDGYPVMGFCSGAPNLYVALTHSGVTLAPLMADLAAIEILDKVRVAMLNDYRPERFT